MLPLGAFANFKIPTVHFTKIELDENEKIIFATETTQKNQEGDFVVTDKRIIVLGKSENYEIPLQELSAVSSITNSVMQISSDERKYYIYVPENQMKYAIAIVRWAYAQIIPK